MVMYIRWRYGHSALHPGILLPNGRLSKAST